MVARSATLATLAATSLAQATTSAAAESDTALPPPPPQPHAKIHTASSSTSISTLTHTSSSSSRVSSNTTPLTSATSSTTVSKMSMRTMSGSRPALSRRGTSLAKSNRPDELDRLGYKYSLRVARLRAAPTKAAALVVPQPSPLASGSSSPRSFGSFRTPEALHDDPLPVRRKRSGLNLRLVGRKDDPLKLPREFLLEFWVVLGREPGDIGWTQAVRTFLGLVQKRGTKTATGTNMREMPALLQTFSMCLNSVSKLAHQSHFLNLLYDSLPASAYFNGTTNDKDKDLLFRLRAEVQMYLHRNETPARTPQFSPDLAAQPPAATHTQGLGLVVPGSPESQASSVNPVTPTDLGPHEILGTVSENAARRKPSPEWKGTGEGLDNFVEAAGAIWGVTETVLEQDADDLDRMSLEKLYLADLKAGLTALSRQGGTGGSDRHAHLSRNLSDLLARFPELSAPLSPVTFTQTSSEAFFTPPRAAAVFSRLSRRAAGTNNRRAAELLERCREIWGVEERAEKERQVETLARQWDAAVGTEDELSLGKRLGEAARELTKSLDPDEELPTGLQDLGDRLLERLAKSLTTIFPTTDAPPPRPAPSLIPLLHAAPDVFLHDPIVSKRLRDLAEQLKYAAATQYNRTVDRLTGGATMTDVTSQRFSGKDTAVEALERVAEWMVKEVENIEKVWPPLGPIDPAAIVISKQLPMFLAELQVVETAGGATSDVFVLYEVTSRLLALWERLCPDVQHGFDIDTFFEPHVVTWLRETEATETYQLVARTVGAENWVADPDEHHSHSVTDLFDFIAGAAKVVRDLPLTDYKRAVYMVDVSRTAYAAISQYTASVHALFSEEIAPREQPKEKPVTSGRAGAWLAKGRHAIGKAKLERQREREGFMIPPTACVKLANLEAAQKNLDGLAKAMHADATTDMLRRLAGVEEHSLTQMFSVALLRGHNILTKGSTKAADSFVTVTDSDTGVRLFKSRTVFSEENPKWEQAFDLSLGAGKNLEVTVYDRHYAGKHKPVGSRTFRLDPRQFTDETVRDMTLPLSPRGVVTLRIRTEGGERFDVAYHLRMARRTLERACADMQRELLDRLDEYLRYELSLSAVASLVKVLREGKRGQLVLSDAQVDDSLVPVLNYLDVNLSILTATCSEETRETLGLAIWEHIVDILVALLVPPLSDKCSTRPALSAQEAGVVFRWLQALKTFFNAVDGGVEHGIPVSKLHAGGYRDMLMLGQVLDLPTQPLLDRAEAAVRAAADSEAHERVAEILLRVVRTRPGVDVFLATQTAALIRAKVQRQGGMM